jgi:hypothetical protein
MMTLTEYLSGLRGGKISILRGAQSSKQKSEKATHNLRDRQPQMQGQAMRERRRDELRSERVTSSRAITVAEATSDCSAAGTGAEQLLCCTPGRSTDMIRSSAAASSSSASVPSSR